MRKIKLNDYKSTQIYMYMFDEMIKVISKKENIIKEEILKKWDINPSSFRRSKVSEQEVGKAIIGKFALNLNMGLISNNYIDELEELFNSIFFDINFRIYYRYEYYNKMLEKAINDKPIILPIVRLMKLFLEMYSKDNFEKFMKANNKEFIELSKFIKFYNDDMMMIYNLLNLVFCKELTYEMQSKKYSNGLSYSVISLRHKIEESYFESLFFAQKAKEIFLKENNFKRAIYINFTILNDFSLVTNFEEYYKLAIEQVYTIRSFYYDKEAKDIEDDIEYKNAIKHVVISSLALKKYDKVCSILSNKNLQTVSEVAALIIAKFNINRESFDQWYLKEIISDNEGDEHLLVLNLLVEYLKKPDKKKLYLIEDTKLLMKSLTNILANT